MGFWLGSAYLHNVEESWQEAVCCCTFLHCYATQRFSELKSCHELAIGCWRTVWKVTNWTCGRGVTLSLGPWMGFSLSAPPENHSDQCLPREITFYRKYVRCYAVCMLMLHIVVLSANVVVHHWYWYSCPASLESAGMNWLISSRECAN